MFGGFTSAFYDRYHELVPKTEPAEEYEQRMQLYELWHQLNHAVMFGSVRSLFAYNGRGEKEADDTLCALVGL
jgi:fructosamine-3-kinase